MHFDRFRALGLMQRVIVPCSHNALMIYIPIVAFKLCISDCSRRSRDSVQSFC